ncbi:MAG: MMPL family transporter [Candidatus Omnitrophica bacterium]|nr:MMPL family transporter [Candidatus Omnitrophota bacterium]
MKKLTFIQIYDKLILARPLVVVLILIALFAGLGSYIKDFRLDASPDSFFLEQDQDLKYFKEVSSRYGVNEFLLLIYKPYDGDLFSDKTLGLLRGLRDELKQLNRVSSVATILDVPLFKSPPRPLKELKTKTITLESAEVDKELAKIELKESPLFRNMLVSPDLKATALQINFARDPAFEKLTETRSGLRKKMSEGTISPLERLALKKISREYRDHRDGILKNQREDLCLIRKIMDKYRPGARLFLGGLPMIVNDMLAFIRADLKLFGIVILAFLIFILGLFFNRIRWIILPLLCCLFSVVVITGLLSAYGWEVTVISSNFISLQLIFTLALTIHLIVRFNELRQEQPGLKNRTLIRETVRTIFKPCLYTALTTIAGFSSLMICDILPVINFGWMMSLGLCVSFAVTFLFFPSCLLLFNQKPPRNKKQFNFSATHFFATFTQKHGTAILTTSIIVLIFTVLGIFKLEVENSFINYFRKTTDIYQGMKFVDQNLGGTTPLDIIIDFKEPIKAPVPKTVSAAAKAGLSDEFDEFDEFDEPAETKNDFYWFTAEKLELIGKIHNYLEAQPATGKVMSLSTPLKFVNQITNQDKPWNNFSLALLFKELSDDFKKIALDPFASIENNQTRLTVRIKDSMKSLRRDAFIKKTLGDLETQFGLDKDQIHLTNLMILYNNMLQSLFRSQIQTIGFTVLALTIMFLILFRSLKIALIAIFPNLLSCLVVLGFMGLKGISLDMMTITIVAISIGIAVDNTIHYLHRFKKEFQQDHNYLKTMFRCHDSIGNAMYYTSITIIAGFSILVLSNFIPTALFGLLTALAMAMALLSALTLLPQLILLFKPFGPERTLF